MGTGWLSNGAAAKFFPEVDYDRARPGPVRCFGEEGLEEAERFFALAAGGFKQAAQDAVILQSVLAAGSLDDFAHDDHGPQAALGLVVGNSLAPSDRFLS